MQRDEIDAYNKKVLAEAEEINKKYAEEKLRESGPQKVVEQTLRDLTKIATESLRAINTLISPFGKEQPSKNTEEIIDTIVSNAITASTIRRGE